MGLIPLLPHFQHMMEVHPSGTEVEEYEGELEAEQEHLESEYEERLKEEQEYTEPDHEEGLEEEPEYLEPEYNSE